MTRERDMEIASFCVTTGTVGNGSVSKRPTLNIALGDLFYIFPRKSRDD